MTDPIPLICPYCGEDVEVDLDESGGSRQTYVEDCQIVSDRLRPLHPRP